MIVALYCCSKDRDNALRLLQWIGDLGGCKGHTMLLSYSREVDTSGHHVDLVEEAQKHFDEVKTYVPEEDDERGWPMSANVAWRQIVWHIRQHVMQPWLWLEPDCVPLKPGWLDSIAAEYETVKDKTPFMGDEVTHPQHRLSGIAVYPARVVAFLTQHILPELNREAWDSFFAADFVRHSHFTKLIQNVWLVSKNPDNLMSFPDHASLSQLRPEAVLFHRSKSGDLIARLRERVVHKYEKELVKRASHQPPFPQTNTPVTDYLQPLPERITETATAPFVRSSRATAMFGNGHQPETVKDLVAKLVEHSKRDGFAKGRIMKELREAGFRVDEAPTMQKKPVKRRRAKATA